MLINLTEQELATVREVAHIAHRYTENSLAFLNYQMDMGGSQEMADDIRRLEAQLKVCDAALAALQRPQEQQGVWVPIEDGEYPMVENAELDGDFLYVTGNTDLEVCTWVERPIETIMLDLGMKICRLTQPAVVAQPVAEPDWSRAPSWARYWTRDISGVIMWWETKPFYDGRYGSWMNEDDSRRARAYADAELRQRPPGDAPAGE